MRAYVLTLGRGKTVTVSGLDGCDAAHRYIALHKGSFVFAVYPKGKS